MPKEIKSAGWCAPSENEIHLEFAHLFYLLPPRANVEDKILLLFLLVESMPHIIFSLIAIKYYFWKKKLLRSQSIDLCWRL
jgi:hypothetical protein